MGTILERLGMKTGKNLKSGMGKVRGWGKPKDWDDDGDGDGDPRRGTGIPVTALLRGD